jgi:hypothetical protein
MPSHASNVPNVSGSRPLAQALIALAGTPEDASGIDERLAVIAGLAVDRVTAVAYASITGVRGEEYTTVAASSDVARAVDEAQYTDGAGPCVQALHDGEPVAVPQIGAMMRWPRFRDTASDLGLRASVSLPLYVGSGGAVAVLNLYGRDHEAIAPLIIAVWSVYDPARPLPQLDGDGSVLDLGAVELVEGFAEAVAVRATILTALSMIMVSRRCKSADAYTMLRLFAAGAGTDLAAAAAAVIAHSG